MDAKQKHNKFRVAPKSDRTLNGMTFDSSGEMNRWCELMLLQKAGEITDLRRQARFLLQPGFTRFGKKERAIFFVADFTYFDRSGQFMVEDFKGRKTEVYKIKRKLFLYRHPGIHFVESKR